MKKLGILIIVIIGAILLGTGIYFVSVKEANKELGGSLVNQESYIYEYNHTNEQMITSTKLIGENLYVLAYIGDESKTDSYVVTVINIYSNKIVKEKKFEIDSENFINLYFIEKNNNINIFALYKDHFEVYDDNFNSIFKKEMTLDYENYMFPYKDTYVYTTSGGVKNLNDEPLVENEKILNSYLYVSGKPIFVYFDYEQNIGNIYILDENIVTLNITSSIVGVTKKGIYYVEDNRFVLYDVENHEKTTTSFKYDLNVFNFYIVNKTIAIYSETEETINVYDMLTNTKIYTFNHLFSDVSSSPTPYFLDATDKFLIFMRQNESKVYILDLRKNNKINEKVLTLSDSELRYKNVILAEEIKEKYNVNIKLYD